MLRLDTIEAIHPAWRPRVTALMDATGVYLQSVWRSRELQARWHWCYQNGCPGGQGCHGSPGNCPGANPPGLSFHEYEEGGVPAALAADLGWSNQSQITKAHTVAASLGLHFPIASEVWHVQPVEAPGQRSPSPGWTPFRPLADYDTDEDDAVALLID